MIWLTWALIHTVFQAIFAELNRVYKIDSLQINFLHSFFAFLVMCLMFPFLSWNLDAKLIIAAFIASSVMTVGCQAQFFLSSKHNGRVASMWQPISVFVSFILWIGLFPETAVAYMENKVILGAIILAFAMIIFSFVLVRRNDIAARTFILVLPIGVLYGLNGVIYKYSLPETNAFKEALMLSFLIYFFMTVFSFGAAYSKRRITKELFSPTFVKAGLVIGLASALSQVTILLSFAYAINPGFTGVIGMLSPVWIMVFHRLRGIHDDASPWAGLIMILGAILLGYATLQ